LQRRTGLKTNSNVGSGTITERHRADEESRKLSGKLITPQEDERKRIARDLHDDLNQRLALLSVT
jgi:signal transduction histidine kinase